MKWQVFQETTEVNETNETTGINWARKQDEID